MADNILGFIATIDVTDLKAGLSQVKQAINKTKAEFDTATSSLENWQKCSEGVGAKLKQLNLIYAAQEKAVETYKNEIERVSKLEGDHSTQLEILQSKLEKAQNNLNKTKVQIDKYSKSYETLKKKEEEENSENSKLLQNLDNNRNKLKSLESQYKSVVLTYGKYSKEAKEVATQVKKTTKEIKDQEEQVSSLSKSFNKLTGNNESFKNIGSALSSSINTIQNKLTSLYSNLTSAISTTKEYRDSQTRLQTTFKDVGLSAESLTSNYDKLYSVIADNGKISEALSYLAQLGVSEQDLGKYTDTLIGIYAKFGDAIPINELSQNINEAVKTGEVTGQLSDALKQVGVDEEAFKNYLSLTTTEQDRQQAILKVLSSNYTELGEAYKKNNEELLESNDNQNEYNKTLSKVGTLGEELQNKILALKTQALDKIYPVIEKVIKFITDNFDTIARVTLTIAGIIGTIATLSKTISGLSTILGAVTNPIGAVVTAVTILATIGITVYKNWDKIKELFSNFWNNIQDSWNNLVTFFSELPSKIINGFKELPNKIAKFFSNAWEKIKEAWSNPGEFFTNVINNIVKLFKKIPEKIKEIFLNLINSIGNWCIEAWDKVKNFFTGKKIEISAEVNEITFNDNSKPDISQRVIVKPNFDFTNLDDFKEACLNYYDIAEGTFDNIASSVDGSIDLIQEKLAKIYPEKSTIESGLQDWIDSFSNIYNVSEEELVNLLKLYKYNTKAVGELLKTEYSYREETTKTSLENITNEEQQFLDRIKQLNTEFDNSLSTVHTQEQLENLKKTYSEKLADIKQDLSDYEKFNGEVSSSVKDGIEDIEDTIQNADLGLADKFQNEMKKISSQASKWGTKIASYLSDLTSALNDYWQTQIDNIDSEWEAYEEELDAKQEAYEEELEAEKEALEEYYEDQADIRDQALEDELDANAQAYKDGLIDDKEYFLNKYKINEKYNTKAEKDDKDKAEKLDALNRANTDYAKQCEEEKAAKEKELLAEKNELSRKQFEAQKANDIAQVWIKCALAILTAYAESWILGIAATIALPIIAGIQTAAIAQQTYTPLTALAEGGVVDKPTQALIGEDGKEAVVPLENNTGWINELADKLNTLMQKDFSIGASSSGAVYYTGDTINNYNYDQTINSPKSLTRREIYKESKNLLSLKKYGG